MKLSRLWVLRGPNAWAVCPVIEAGLDLNRLREQPTEQIVRATERVLAWLPSHTPHLGKRKCTDSLAHLVERVALQLQTLAGNAVAFGATRAQTRAGRYRVAVEYQEEPVGRACLQVALEICRAAWEGRSFAIAEELSRLRDLAAEQRLGPSTFAVVEAARARGIPVDYLNPDDGRYLQLGHGARQRRTLAAETDDISAIARSLTTDKHLTKQLLRAVGVPVPQGRPVSDAEDAWAAACELGVPVAVKPQDRDLGQGVGLNLRTRDQVEAAYRAAREKSSYVLVERFASGTEHRVLVVADRVVAVARIEPPQVVGDGESSVDELVAAVNRDPRRGDDYRSPLRRLKIDASALEVLAAEGYTPTAIPARGVRVLLRRNPPYIENGGRLNDLTECIHPQVAAHAVDAARALHLRVAGMDILAEDIGRPLEEQGGVVVEVNAGPGLGLHTAPCSDTPRPVGAAIVATLFPPGSDGRIPIVAIAGAQGQAAAGRYLAELLTKRGRCVGRTSSEAIFVAGKQILLPGTSARAKVRAVLQNNLVEVAVLEASARDLLHEGLGCDRCDVALVTDLPAPGEIAADADDAADELIEAYCAVRSALTPSGKVVLNAEDPPPAWASLPTARTVWFSPHCQNPRLLDHRAGGGTAAFLCDDAVVLAYGADEQRLPLGERLRNLGQRERLALLAALAAAVAISLSPDELQAYLAR